MQKLFVDVPELKITKSVSHCHMRIYVILPLTFNSTLGETNTLLQFVSCNLHTSNVVLVSLGFTEYSNISHLIIIIYKIILNIQGNRIPSD